MNSPAIAPPSPDVLARECAVFCRYLTGQSASAFVAEKYAAAHARDARYGRASVFDRVLLRLAAASPLLAQCADSYACVAARASLLRKKLVLLIAILESSAPEHGFDEQIQDTAASAVIARTAGRGLLFAGRFVLAAIVLAPVQFLCAVGEGWGRQS